MKKNSMKAMSSHRRPVAGALPSTVMRARKKTARAIITIDITNETCERTL
jgi:hypothetical protein